MYWLARESFTLLEGDRNPYGLLIVDTYKYNYDTMTMNESPYTFQKSLIPAEALIQSKHWYDRKGKLHVIKEMDPFHARGAYKKLEQTYGVGGASSPLGKALSKRARESRSTTRA